MGTIERSSTGLRPVEEGELPERSFSVSGHLGLAGMRDTLGSLADQIGIEELEPLVGQFARDVDAAFATLQLACRANDSVAVERMLHRLKGLLQQLGATEALVVLRTRPSARMSSGPQWLLELNESLQAAVKDAEFIVARMQKGEMR